MIPYKILQMLLTKTSVLSSRSSKFSRIIVKHAHSSVRVRFAPSPTGFMHIGGLRTALINKLFAAKESGVFILRIEDTDRLRYNPQSLHDIIESLTWSNLIPDEGPVFGGNYGPYIQSERCNFYTKAASRLLESGVAYRCFCSPERLQIIKKEQARQGQALKYDNRCRNLTTAEIEENLSAGMPFTIRVKNDGTQILVDDLIFGNLQFDSDENEGDFIILKSDGMPVYHFANVVDDHFMQISHVIRGAEWLSSTPKHLLLYQMLGWSAPKFAHIPLILAESGGKLSKRSPEFAQVGQVRALRAQGYLPSSVLTWLTSISGAIITDGNVEARTSDTTCVGWYPGLQFSDLVDGLDLAKMSHQNARLSLDTLKLCGRTHFDQMAAEAYEYCNHHNSSLKDNYKTPQLLHDVRNFLRISIHQCKSDSYNTIEDDLQLSRILSRLTGRVSCLSDLVDPATGFLFLWQPPDPLVCLDVIKTLFLSKTNLDALALFFNSFLHQLELLPNDQTPTNTMLDFCIKTACQSSGLKRDAAMRLIRLSLMGCETGAPVIETIHLLKVEEAIRRINNLTQVLSHRKEDKSQSG